MRIPRRTLWATVVLAAVLLGALYFWSLRVVEVERVVRGTAISAVYGTVRIEPSFVVHVRAQNNGYIHLADTVATGRGAIGESLKKGELLATITDETATRQLKQAQTDLRAAEEQARLELPSSEPLKVAEANVARLEKLNQLSNIPTVEYEKARSEAKRLRDQLEAEKIERERNLQALREAVKKAEALTSQLEIRATMDGILSDMKAIDGEFVTNGTQLFTVSSRKNYVRGEVNEEDIGEVKVGMPAIIQMYAYRTQQFKASVTSIVPTADPETQRYTVLLDMLNPPDNLLAGMTGEMNIITGRHENALLVPTRAVLVDQVWVVKNGLIEKRTVKIGYRTLEFSEALNGLKEGEHVVVSDQDKLKPGEFVRQRMIKNVPPVKPQ
ncbi:MAG TPA: efflux RND transporter periplasmic adaptor subunit [Chthoniobacterales bacterium]